MWLLVDSMKNHHYQWKGINSAGKIISGSLSASCVAMAKIQLHHQGIRCTKVGKKRLSVLQKIKQAELTLFLSQLASMLKVGIPLIQSLAVIGNNQTNLHLKNLVFKLKHEIENGFSLSEVFLQHESHFNELIGQLIAVGEKSGKLDLILEQIVQYKEKNDLLKKKVGKILIYPLVVLIFTGLITGGLLVFVIPQFAQLFASFGAELPLLTRMIFKLADFIGNYWLFFFSLFIFCLYGFVICKKQFAKFAFAVDRILLRFPFFGKILEKSIIARFTRTLAITFAAGMPLCEALKAVESVAVNLVYSQATVKISEELAAGQSMQVALKNASLFPPFVLQLVAIGEETGELEMMLTKIAGFYEDEINSLTDSLTNLLEPIMITLLGLIVGSLVIAMYLPIFKLGSVL